MRDEKLYDDIERLREGLRQLWSELSPERRAELEALTRAGHEFLLQVREAGRAGADSVPESPVPRELLMVYSLLHDDPHGLLEEALTTEGGNAIVGAEGEVYFGGVDFDVTDPKWGYCLWAWDFAGETPPFVERPPVVRIPDSVKIAILGDWGGNNAAAKSVAQAALGKKPDLFVHLGDVYYAGTNEEGWIERNYQDENFLNPWPGKAGRSFNLNSNHDMYAHAIGYYATLHSPIFSAQQGCSYFALVNRGYRLVGLDTAYFDPDRSGHGFMTGALNDSQEKFLAQQAAEAAQAGQALVLLTHHNGLSMDGESTLPLWDQVVDQLGALEGQSVLWYFGHEHTGAVYRPRRDKGVTIRPRCCGHGCIPWGIPSKLQKSSQVEWFEHRVLQPGPNYFVANGFATLTIDGTSIEETFYDQTGRKSW